MVGSRIDRLDAWRAFCCIGVLWIHCWHNNGSLPINLFGINIAKPLSIIGNGVDFFYVISGFCMYYFYLNKLKANTFQNYMQFVLSRWFRIAPTYYIAILVYIIYEKATLFEVESLKLAATNFLFLQNFSKNFEISGHFWSIAVEWQFYLIFPLIVYSYFTGKKFVKNVVLLTVVVSGIGIYLLTVNYDYDLQLPVRFVEFTAGILMAYYFKSHDFDRKGLFVKLLIGVLILFTGRILNSNEILNYSDSKYIYAIIKVLGYLLLSAGFAILLFLTIGNNNKIFAVLDWTPLAFVGRISYSFYLWHSLVFYFVFEFFHKYILLSEFNSFLLQFIVSLLLTIPIAYISHRFIELQFRYQWKNPK